MKQTNMRMAATMAAIAFLSGAQAQNGPVGFCNYYDGINGITGGMAGQTVHVTTRSDLQKYLSSNDPYTIILDADLTGTGLDRTKDVLEVGSNTTLIGGGSGAALNGIGLNINGKQNIIIRNLTIHHADPDGIAGRNTHHVWVDHCEIYSTDETAEDWDGLIDFTIGSSYITVSYCYIHDHHKCCLLSSGTQHFEDYGKDRTTYHHNAFRLTDQRNPRIGYGLGHVFNNYYEQIGSYCIGGFTQARIVAERNYFCANASNPFCQMYATEGPDDYSFAFFEDRGNYAVNGINYKKVDAIGIGSESGVTTTIYQKIDFEPTDWYDYSFSLDSAIDVKDIYPAKVGPQKDLDKEVILWPGNGAKDQPILFKPQWSKLDNETSSWFTIGIKEANMKKRIIDEDNPLSAGTTYLWRVYTKVGTDTIVSPIYHFTTAMLKPATPFPANGETNAQLRAATAINTMTTAMTLTWQPAADADYYLVSLWDESGKAIMDNQKVTTNSVNPGSLNYGKKYTWRVNTVRAINSRTVTGDTWSFSTPKREIKAGRTELEHLCRSGIVYMQPIHNWPGFTPSNDSVTVGDRGPGAMTGIFAGQPGTYKISVAYLDGSNGKDKYSVSVNEKSIDSWSSSSTSGEVTHTIVNSVHLSQGDQIRVDFDVLEGSGTRGRMDCMDLTLLEADGIETIAEVETSDKIYYDLTGRQVTMPQPGKIYICKGSKRVVKGN